MHTKPVFMIIIISVFLFSCVERATVTVVPRSGEELLKLNILEPENGEIIDSDSVRVVFEAKNFVVGEKMFLGVVLDNGPRLVHHSNEPLYLASLYEGRHIVRAFPMKSWGESVKDLNSLATVQFYVKKNNSELLNLNLPMLTYNEPVGTYRGEKAKRILLDFLVSNVVLSKNGYKVVYTLDDGRPVELTTDSPIYLTNLKPGSHNIVLELVDKNGNLAEGNFVRTQREFVVS